MANWNRDYEQTERDILDILRRDEDTMLAMGTGYYEDERDIPYPDELEDEDDVT